MSSAYAAYRFLSTGLFATLAPLYGLYTSRRRSAERRRQRLGHYRPTAAGGAGSAPTVWVHAVSVGEVGVALAIIEALRQRQPDCPITLSTATVHGDAVARERASHLKAAHVVAPFDFIPAVRRALNAVQPAVLVCLETELWPNWIMEAHRAGVRVALVNGRISVRSIKNYLRVKALMAHVLARMDALSMIDAEDARRVVQLGAPPQRVLVNGNAKYDSLARRADPQQAEALRSRFGLKGGEPVVMAGSTRRDEEVHVLDAYQEVRRCLPDALLFIAPRHVERAGRVRRLAEERGLACQFRTDLERAGAVRHAPVVIMDTIGELQTAYGLASIVFCGGSLVPLGGQNVMEAAVWGKPVLYGPSMEDFSDAKQLLERTGGGRQVNDAAELARVTLHLLRHPREAAAVGDRARAAVLANRGAAERHAGVIHGLMGESRQPLVKNGI